MGTCQPANKLSYLDEQSQPRENARAGGRSCQGPRKGERSLEALLSLPCPPLWRLLSRAPRASTFHNIPQMESLLAGQQLARSELHALLLQENLCLLAIQRKITSKTKEQRDIPPSEKKKCGQRDVVSNAHVKFVTLKLALPTRK